MKGPCPSTTHPYYKSCSAEHSKEATKDQQGNKRVFYSVFLQSIKTTQEDKGAKILPGSPHPSSSSGACSISINPSLSLELHRPQNDLSFSCSATSQQSPVPCLDSPIANLQSTSNSSQQVDDTSADLIISQLLLLDAQDQTKDIKLFINSPGGSITAGMGVYDAMKFCKADISTVCFGLAASMGAFLLAAGTKGKRYCMPNARIMIHQPSGGAGGKVTEMGLQIREMLYEKIKINKIMSRITGKSEKQIDEDTKFDYFMSPWEAKDYGIVDSIIDEGKPGLVAPMAGSVPPPKSRVWYLWKASGPTRKIMKHLPSEEKLIHNGNGSATGDDGKLKEASAT